MSPRPAAGRPRSRRAEIRELLEQIRCRFGVELEMGDSDLPEVLVALRNYERHLDKLARRQGRPLHVAPGGRLRRAGKGDGRAT